MTDCKEYFLDDARAITAIPISEAIINEADPTALSNQLTATIASEGYGLAETIETERFSSDAIAIGLYQPAFDVVGFVPMLPGTGKAKDTEGDSVAGRMHTVSVTCEVDDRDASVWEHLLKLERTPCHLELTFRDGKTRAFVAGSEDTYHCHVERDGKKTTVTFRIQNLMGIQLLVPASQS